jgi:hypothetical protein
MPSYEEWAQTSGLLNRYPNAGGKQDDPDGDGLTNLEEMLAGTDPTRRESVLAFQSGPRLDDLVEAEREPVASTQLALYFQSVPGKVYQIQGANELGGEWHTVATAAASTTQKRVVWNKTDPHFFFRILVLPPP